MRLDNTLLGTSPVLEVPVIQSSWRYDNGRRFWSGKRYAESLSTLHPIPRDAGVRTFEAPSTLMLGIARSINKTRTLRDYLVM